MLAAASSPADKTVSLFITLNNERIVLTNVLQDCWHVSLFLLPASFLMILLPKMLNQKELLDFQFLLNITIVFHLN